MTSNDKRDGLACEVLDEYNEHNADGCVCVRCTQHNRQSARCRIAQYAQSTPMCIMDAQATDCAPRLCVHSHKMRVRYDHDINFYDYPGGVLLMMALEISNASVSYDIEGAQVKLDQLTLLNYPGEDVSAFCSDAQKQIKVMQSGYPFPFESVPSC
jgi:hypothetical protein